jgi:hypothetical protein
MTVTDDGWRRLYEICDPTHRLQTGDLDLFVERPDSVARRIADTLRAGYDTKGKWIVSGSVGAGKSTELTALAQLLRDDFAVVGVDLWQSAGRIDQVTPAEILFCVGAAAVRSVKAQFGHAVDPGAVQSLGAAFEGLLDERRAVDVNEFIEGVALFGVDLFAPGAGAATSAALRAVKAATGPQKLRIGHAKVGGFTRPVKEGDPALEQLVWAVDEVLADIRQIREPLILVDGLDKLTEIMAIRDLFATSRVLASPQAPLVYTGPVTLMVNAEWSAAGNYFMRERLPNLAVAPPTSPLRTVSPQTIAAGRAGVRDVVLRRARQADLDPDQAFSPEALELLISKSGGLLRQLLALLRHAIKQAGLEGRPRVEIDLATAACDVARKEFEITMTDERRRALEFIADHGEPEGGAHELLLWNYAIPYANGELWFAPNPLINLAQRAP